jgi:hypothetical protein
MWHHDYSQVELIGGINNYLCSLLDDFVMAPEAIFGFLGFLSTFYGKILAIFGLVWKTHC